MRAIYTLDHAHDVSFDELVAMLGRTGATLADISVGLGLPVPPGFVVTTLACRSFLATGAFAEADIDEAREETRRLARADGFPLLVGVRPSTPTFMPGAAPVVLNVGLNDETVVELAEATGDERFAYDSYRRLIQMYGNVVCGVPIEEFERRIDGAKTMAGVTTESELGVAESRLLAQTFLTMLDQRGTPFPQDVERQVLAAVEAVFRSWDSPQARAYRQRENIPHDLGMAVIVQQMVFGNRDERSGSGLAFSRHPVTGAKEPYGDFRVGGQGVDAGTAPVVAIGDLRDRLPEAWAQLEASFAVLESHYRDMISLDFAVEQGTLQFLGVRPGDRSGAAAVRIAKQLADPDDLGLDRSEALLRVTADHLDQILHPQFSGPGVSPIASGLGASPGAAVGAVYFDPNTAVDAYDEGIDVILVKDETSPEDVHGMAIAEGILTTKGGLASHAAVVARGWGKPAVCGAGGITIGEGLFTVGNLVVREGDIISLDGATGEVFLGAVDLSEGDVPAEMHEILGWADEIRAGKLAVRANADTPDDALVARGTEPKASVCAGLSTSSWVSVCRSSSG
ncbi:MAG: PEP/pyruvate-binding domain-containing protein [Acidimicrobiales bacterium]